MKKSEEMQLNKPTRNYFRKKIKSGFARTEFVFSAGKLDVLAYDRKDKCFHICEGKMAGNITSVGHAIGQLIAYITMIQEKGYDFLNRISKEERLELSDFASFLENKAIRVCFYVILPKKNKEKLLSPAKLMLKNLGDFGSSIGIFFSDKGGSKLVLQTEPVSIQIRRIYSRDEFLEEIRNKFLQSKQSGGLVSQRIWPGLNYIQFKEKDGNPLLHFEVWLRKRKKADPRIPVEIAFHLEFAKAHLKDATTAKRKKRLQKLMKETEKDLLKRGERFKFKKKWGKNWSSLFSLYKTGGRKFDQDDVAEVLRRLIMLVESLKTRLDKINWGRKRKKQSKQF